MCHREHPWKMQLKLPWSGSWKLTLCQIFAHATVSSRDSYLYPPKRPRGVQIRRHNWGGPNTKMGKFRIFADFGLFLVPEAGETVEYTQSRRAESESGLRFGVVPTRKLGIFEIFGFLPTKGPKNPLASIALSSKFKNFELLISLPENFCVTFISTLIRTFWGITYHVWDGA